MKLNFNTIFLLLFLSAALGCKQRMITPIIPTGERVVLIEEFTGKGCTNCPKGSRELENLQSIYQDQLVVVSIHANFFADPVRFPLGQYDLRTDEGEMLFTFFGPNFGYPAGMVDRRKINGEYQLPLSLWAGIVAEEAAVDPLVEFTIEKIYDPLSRHLNVSVEGRAKFDVTDPVHLSVMITESGIIDAQDVAEAGGVVEDYVHNHVLRDMLTPFDGMPLAMELTAAQDFNADFAYTLPDEWNANTCSIIVFVSYAGTSGDRTVLQAGEVHVTE